MSLPDPVQAAVTAGFAVVPADKSKRPKVPWKMWTEGAQTEAEAQALGHGSLWAVITGALYGVVLLDFDKEHGGMDTLAALGLEPHVLTPGGAHVYVRHPGHPVRNSARKFAAYPGMDIRGEHGLAWFHGRSTKGAYTQVVWPPSPITLDPELSAWLFPHPQNEKVTRTADEAEFTGPGYGEESALRYLKRAASDIENAPPGSSNAELNKAGYAVGGLVAAGQLNAGHAFRTLSAAAEKRGASDIDVVLDAAVMSGAESPWKFNVAEDEWVPAVAYKVFRAHAMPEAQDFPIEALPEPLGELVRQGSSALSCPPDYLGAGLLPVLGVGIGGLVDLAVTETWRESALLYVALVGAPGARKTPGINLLMAPVWKAEGRLEDIAREDAGDAWAEVEPPSLVVDDSTIEALFAVLEKNERGVILQPDELTGWIGGMGQYKGGLGRDRQHWLSIWSRRPIKVSRVKSRSRSIRSPFVAVLGGIQPEPLEALMHGKDDGLLPRLLMAGGEFVTPKLRQGALDMRLLDSYDDLWNRLRDEGAIQQTVPFTDAGYRAFEVWVNEHYKTLKHLPPELAGAWAKMDGQAARIALIMARVQGTNVDEDAVTRAISLVHYFQGQATTLLRGTAAGSPFEKQQAGRLKSVARYLQEHPDAGRSDLMAMGPEWALDSRTMDRLLETLRDMGIFNG